MPGVSAARDAQSRAHLGQDNSRISHWDGGPPTQKAYGVCLLCIAPVKVDRALRERPKVVLSKEAGLDGGWIINGAQSAGQAQRTTSEGPQVELA